MNILKYIFAKPDRPSDQFLFKIMYTFDERVNEAKRLLELDLGSKVPIIIEKEQSSMLPNLPETKFLLSRTMTVEQLMIFIRNKLLKIPSSKKMYLLIDQNIIPATDSTINTLYEKYMDKDDWLYIKLVS